MIEFLLILPLAALLDTFLGNPFGTYHPLRLLGHVIDGGHRELQTWGLNGHLLGITVVVVSLIPAVGGYLLMEQAIFPWLNTYVVLTMRIFVVYCCLGFRSMFDRALEVVVALRENETNDAREALKAMVIRNVDHLDRNGIARAAVESLADEFINGLLTPVFWFCTGALFGLMSPMPASHVAIMATLLSRITGILHATLGYPHTTLQPPGMYATVLNEIMKFLPARMAVPILFVSSLLTDADTDMGIRTWLRNRHDLLAPGTGSVGSFLAGALHVRLGGPVVYPRGVVEHPWLGEGTSEVTEVHVKQALYLLIVAGIIVYFCAFLFLVGVHRVQLSMTAPY